VQLKAVFLSIPQWRLDQQGSVLVVGSLSHDNAGEQALDLPKPDAATFSAIWGDDPLNDTRRYG
jgi:hypothetical protein